VSSWWRHRRRPANPDTASAALGEELVLPAPPTSFVPSTTRRSSRLRGFVLDSITGAPLPNIVVALRVQIDKDAWLPLGVLATDQAGYLSFDISSLQNLTGLRLRLELNVEPRIVDLTIPLVTIGPHFVVRAVASKLARTITPQLPALQAAPDPDDLTVTTGAAKGCGLRRYLSCGNAKLASPYLAAPVIVPTPSLRR
jgi:hypothetical protein